MKILNCVEFYKPSTGGVQYHMELITNALLRKNFKVEVATKLNNERNLNKFSYKIHQFNCSGNLVNGLKGTDANKYQDFLINSKFDYILFYAAQQWTFDIALSCLHLIKSKKIFVPCGFSKIKSPNYYLYYYLLKKKINYFDEIVCFSKQTKDYNFLDKIYKKKINVIPNGGENFKNIKILKNKKKYLRILNVANFSFLKNQFSLILASIFFKHKFKIYFIYSNNNFYEKVCYSISKTISFFSKRKQYIFLKNLPRTKIKKFYKGCDIFIFTSLVECSPLVIYDCLTSKLRFFSSDVGNCKEISKYTKNSKIFLNYYNLIKDTNRLKFNKNKNEYRIYKKFYWESILKQYAKLFKKK